MHLLHCSALAVSNVIFSIADYISLQYFPFHYQNIVCYKSINIFSVPAVMWFVQTVVQMFPPVHK